MKHLQSNSKGQNKTTKVPFFKRLTLSITRGKDYKILITL